MTRDCRYPPDLVGLVGLCWWWCGSLVAPMMHGGGSFHKSYRPRPIDQGFLTGGKFPPWGKYWEFRGEMRAFENW